MKSAWEDKGNLLYNKNFSEQCKFIEDCKSPYEVFGLKPGDKTIDED